MWISQFEKSWSGFRHCDIITGGLWCFILFAFGRCLAVPHQKIEIAAERSVDCCLTPDALWQIWLDLSVPLQANSPNSHMIMTDINITKKHTKIKWYVCIKIVLNICNYCINIVLELRKLAFLANSEFVTNFLMFRKINLVSCKNILPIYSSSYISVPTMLMKGTEVTLHVLTNPIVLDHICSSLHGERLHQQLSGFPCSSINKYAYDQFAWWQDSDCIVSVRKVSPLRKASLIKQSLNVCDSFSSAVQCTQRRGLGSSPALLYIFS